MPPGRVAIGLVRALEGGRAAGKEQATELVELLANRAEGGVELLLDLGIEPRDQLLGGPDRPAQVGVLATHLLESCRDLAVLLHGEWVDRADLGEGPSHASDLLLERLVVEGPDLIERRLSGRLREAVQRQLALAREGGQCLVPT